MILALADRIQPPHFISEGVCLLACLERRIGDLGLANFINKRSLYEMLTETGQHFLQFDSGNKTLSDFLGPRFKDVILSFISLIGNTDLQLATCLYDKIRDDEKTLGTMILY